MKNYLSLLFGSLIIAFMLVMPGNVAQAEETGEEPCDCHNVAPIQGVERNKMVADLLKTDVFKNVKAEAMQNGFKWNGAQGIEIMHFNVSGSHIIGVSFESEAGVEEMFAFLPNPEGGFIYGGHTPK